MLLGGGLDPLVSAFKTDSGATDVDALDTLIKYVRGEGLINNFVIYPMKSAQNAGSGSTVYSLGGLTTNDMTLVNSPTWASDGLDYNGTNQYATAADFIGAGDVTAFARAKDWTPESGTTVAAIFAQWNSATNQRSWFLGSRNNAESTVKSSDGSSLEVYIANDAATSYVTDRTYVGYFANSDDRALYRDKSSVAIALDFGAAQTARLNSTAAVTVGNSDGGGGIYTPFTGVAFAVVVGTLTTAQREQITDYINAL
jgi:hypothetical protein